MQSCIKNTSKDPRVYKKSISQKCDHVPNTCYKIVAKLKTCYIQVKTKEGLKSFNYTSLLKN